MPKICIYENCKTYASFGNKNDTVATFCNKHKSAEMISVINKNKICIYKDCDKRATYNIKGEKRGIYCFKHKSDEMENVLDKNCEHENCNIRATYNFRGNTKVRFCEKHKLDGMISIKNKGKLCKFDGCDIRASYNFEGEKKGIYCMEHMLNGMKDVSNKNCEFEGCTAQPIFNYIGEKSVRFCAKHKLQDMFPIHSKFCKTHLCLTIISDKYEGYCFRCYCFLFSDKPIVRNYKTKENEVINFIKSSYPNQSWIINRQFEGGCSLKLPDIRCDFGFHILIVEVDENQHKDRGLSCETKRLAQLSEDVNHRPIVCIRFNPDNYIDENGKTIKSCWSLSKETKKLRIDTKQIKKWNARLEKLKETIDYFHKNDRSCRTLLRLYPYQLSTKHKMTI
jgi:hypothetical protein